MRWEHWWFTARLRLKSILLRRRVERELDEELREALVAHSGDRPSAIGLLDGVMKGVGGMDQRLRWNAAHVEASATETTIDAALLGQHDVEAELAGADRRDVAAGSAAHDQNLGIDVRHLTPL